MRCSSDLVCRERVTFTAQMFNASHMAPYDNPHVAHDMILRFMGLNFSAVADGSARIPSSVGDDVKPILIPGDHKPNAPLAGTGKTPVQDKAMWEGNSSSLPAVGILMILISIL
jgi:carboxypeptidase D